MQIFRKSVPAIQAGDNVGVLLRGIKIANVQRGMLLCSQGTEQISNHFDGSMYLLARNEGGRSRPLTSKYIQQIFSRTWNVPCRIDLCMYSLRGAISAFGPFTDSFRLVLLVESDMIMPGEHGQVRLTLFKKMVMTAGQQFTIRENGKTVATGIVTQTRKSVELPYNKLSKAEVVQ